MTNIQRLTVLAVALLIVPLSRSVADEPEVVKVELYVTVPADTDPDATIYLAGNLPELGGWRADGVALKRVNGDNVYHADLMLPRGATIEYKITCGSWETVEKGPGGEEIHNRTLKLERDTVKRINVETWRKNAAGVTTTQRKSSITGDVRVHDVESTILRNRRRVLVWLPPDYEQNSNQRYAVLYMHDGQNLFDDATSFAGEWHADEIADSLIREKKIPPIIIVGIENTPQRALEYTPGSPSAPGKAQLYARFVVEEIKPFVDQNYRTLPDRAHTGVAGSSLGGLVSLYMLQQYPQVFGGCAAVSPSLWWDDRLFLQGLVLNMSWAQEARVWIDMGTDENIDPDRSRQNVEDCLVLVRALEKSGRRADKDFAWRPVEGAAHNEQAWAERFDDILVFLYGSKR